MACNTPHTDQRLVKNALLKEHVFLPGMRANARYPEHVVNRCDALLTLVCLAIETEGVKEVRHLYPITDHYMSEMSKQLVDFEREGVMLGDAAREELAAEFLHIAKAYGFEVDTMRLMQPRAW